MGTRTFCEKQYSEHDVLGKRKFQSFCEKQGFEYNIPNENKGIDATMIINGIEYKCEIEVKKSRWKSKKDFPFHTVSFLGRKKRLHDKGPFYYFIFSYYENAALCCNSINIYKDEYITNKFADRKNGNADIDEYYHVPKSRVYFFTP